MCDLYAQIKKAGPRGSYRLGETIDFAAMMAAEEYDGRQRRDAFIEAFSFAIPDRNAIDKIVEFVGGRSLLEVGAGSGLWARLIADAGVDVCATDNYLWSKRDVGDGRMIVHPLPIGKFYPVSDMDAVTAINSHPGHAALLTVWPFMDSMAYDAASAFRGDRLIYVGEGPEGCTADARFHKLMRSRKWRRHALVGIPCWPHIYDSMSLYERRRG